MEAGHSLMFTVESRILSQFTVPDSEMKVKAELPVRLESQ